MSTASPTIMIVDDVDQDRDVVTRLLGLTGLTAPMTTVADASRAQASLREHGDKLRLALFDICMPWIDGFQLLTWVRRQPRFEHLKVVMMTGADDPDDFLQALDLGANGYFCKYPNVTKFAGILREVVPDLISAAPLDRSAVHSA